MSNEQHRQRKRGRPPSPFPEGVEEPNAFARWLVERNLSPQDVARVLGVNGATVYGYRRGTRPPSRKMAARIEKLTDGAVPASTWD